MVLGRAPCRQPTFEIGYRATDFVQRRPVRHSHRDPLRIRTDPNRQGAIIATITPDTSVTVKQGPVVDKEKIVWYQVAANGTTGWVMAQYLEQAKAPAHLSAQTQAKMEPAGLKTICLPLLVG